MNTAICIFNEGHQVSLKIGKEYIVLPDELAEYHDRLRVIDETGESYLYPKSFFMQITKSSGNIFLDLGFEPEEAACLLSESKEKIAFEQWATENLGQGYPLTMDEHEYENVVTRWAFRAWKAGRQQLRSEK